jgi:molybdate transport system permease protein
LGSIFTSADLSAIWLTCKLATTVTIILLLAGTPLAWWLARTRCWCKGAVAAMVALPIVLPPTVIGFYLLVAMGPKGPLGQLTLSLGLGVLPFTFAGLVVGSVIYSLPFVVQPLQNAFESIPERTLETAATLRATALDRFFSVVLPLAKPGLLTASVLGFAHTVGEFGVVLMIGGNIPDQTRVVSVQIYDHVEAMDYAQAHWLSGAMLLFSFAVLLVLYTLNPTGRRLRHVTDITASHSTRRANDTRQVAGYGEASRLRELPPVRLSRVKTLLNNLMRRTK